MKFRVAYLMEYVKLPLRIVRVFSNCIEQIQISTGVLKGHYSKCLFVLKYTYRYVYYISNTTTQSVTRNHYKFLALRNIMFFRNVLRMRESQFINIIENVYGIMVRLAIKHTLYLHIYMAACGIYPFVLYQTHVVVVCKHNSSLAFLYKYMRTPVI